MREPTDYYSTAYTSYEGQNPVRKLDHYVDSIRHRTPVASPRLLDLGCGRGLFLERAASRFPDWMLAGIDPEPTGVRTTSTLVPTATIRRGAANDIPFPAGNFDVVTAWDVLEHVEDLDAGLSEAKRCLTTGGLLLAVVPVYDGVAGPLVRRLDSDSTHIHRRSRSFWVDLMMQHLDDVRWHGIFRNLISRSKYIHVPTRKLRRATPAILVSGFRR